MKTNSLASLFLAAAVLGTCCWPAPAHAAFLDDTFTYQGQLNDSNGPVNGTYDFRFRLFTTLDTSSAFSSFITNSAVQVTDGLFTTSLKFGHVFDGTAFWLRIDVKTNASSSFTTLSPRQPLTATPNALYATNAAYAENAGSAATADSVSASAVTAAGIANATITASKLATNIGVWTKSAPNIYFNGGNVGIGTSTPDANLEIQPSGNSDSVLRITSPGISYPGNYNSTLQLVDVQTNGWSIFKDQANHLSLRDAKTGIERVRLLANGSVGIGDFAENTNYASRVLAIAGNPAAPSFPGTAAVVLKGSPGGNWAISTYTDGNLHITKDGNETDEEVVVPILTVIGGSDIAEPFNVHGEEAPQPGMVLAIDPERTGELRVCAKAYDSTVAGIVSGAGGVKTGMKLKQDGTAATGNLPVALTGRVYCYVDADAGGSIFPGDLLTTSATPGHAMKATDSNRSGGSILGKAMSPLKSGKGLVLVLVSLQ